MISIPILTFDLQQQEAIRARNGVWVCLAGPGSGKTAVLVERHIQMLTEGIPSSDMLNLTFTNAAATTMAKRTGIIRAEENFRTFHSFAINFLKKERLYLPFKLCDTVIPVQSEDYQLFFDLVKRYPGTNWRTMRDSIVEWKCKDILPHEAIVTSENRGIRHSYAKAYYHYEEECRRQGWLDFDDCIRETVNLLMSNDEVRNRWKRKYLSVDEAQDCDVVQFQLLDLLFDGNLFVVGDENQLIFEWRSAQANNLSKFALKFPEAKYLYLGTNYRSTKELVQFFKNILPVDNGIASFMTTPNEIGVKPVITRYEDEFEEINQVLASIADPEHTAILARTNQQLFAFQKKCTMLKIKYRILGKKDFWEQNEVKKLLKLAKDFPSQHMPASKVLALLIDSHNLLQLYAYAGDLRNSNPVENLNDIVKMAVGKGTIAEFLTSLRKLTHARRSRKGLTLSTVHQAKGREWDHVYLVGASQGLLPHKDGEINEEHRIFFVACSRAAKDLHISFSGLPSQFLRLYYGEIRDHIYIGELD